MDYEILLLNIARNASERALHFQECLGQHLIASYISQFGFRARVYSGDVLECKNVINYEIAAHHVKIVGFYTGADTVVMVGNIIRWLKKTKDVTTVAGGPEAYALEEDFLRRTGCDYIIPGEGEIPVLNLLKFIVDGVGERHQIKSLRFIDAGGTYIATPPEELIMDLDSLPFPNYENSLNKRFRRGESIGVLTGRGCPFHCGFCFEGAASKTVRFRSMENVIAEIEGVRKNNHMLRCVNVYDDTFTLNKYRVMEFCKYMKKTKMSWSCEGHVMKLFHNPDMVDEMVESGLIAMQIGIESGSRKVLEAYEKNTTPEMIKEVVKRCKEAGLLTLEGNYIIGGALESRETIEESIQHARELIELGHGMLELSTVFFSPYYGTPITREPQKYEMQIEKVCNEHTVITMRDAVVSTKYLSAAEIARSKQHFDDELKQKYYEEAKKCSRHELLRGAGRNNRKVRINQNWCAAWDSIPFIKEFTKHMAPEEQSCESHKFPIRTIGGYWLEEDKFAAQGIELTGLEKDAVLLADGRKTVAEIGQGLGIACERMLEVYSGLNDRCLVYFSEF